MRYRKTKDQTEVKGNKEVKEDNMLRERSENSTDPNEEIKKANRSKNKKVLRKIEDSNPLQCYIVKNDKFLPRVRSKKMLQKTTINKACKPLIDFHSNIVKMRT